MSKITSFLVLAFVMFTSFACTGPKADLGSIVTFDYTGTFKKRGKINMLGTTHSWKIRRFDICSDGMLV